MGYEKTLPSNHLIALFTVLTVILLGGLHFAFESYFSEVVTGEVGRKILTVESVKLERLRTDEARRLAGANVEAAMKALAGGARPAAITPQKGVDLEARLAQLGSLSGWAEDSHPLALAMARRDEARAYLAEMRASVDKARAEGNQEALDTLLPRLQTAEESVVRLQAELAEILGNQTEAGLTSPVRNPEAGPPSSIQPDTPANDTQGAGGTSAQGSAGDTEQPSAGATDAGQPAPTAPTDPKPVVDAGTANPGATP